LNKHFRAKLQYYRRLLVADRFPAGSEKIIQTMSSNHDFSTVKDIFHKRVKLKQGNTMNTHTHPFNSPLSGTTQVSWYQKAKTNLDFTEASDSEWQWHQLGHMQVCTLPQKDNHASTPPLSFLQAGCPSCRPTNSECQSTEG